MSLSQPARHHGGSLVCGSSDFLLQETQNLTFNFCEFVTPYGIGIGYAILYIEDCAGCVPETAWPAISAGVEWSKNDNICL